MSWTQASESQPESKRWVVVGYFGWGGVWTKTIARYLREREEEDDWNDVEYEALDFDEFDNAYLPAGWYDSDGDLIDNVVAWAEAPEDPDEETIARWNV